eukprot:TRINITY_DN21440_c0_g1_i1.p2 TRINITY_DN21440_c0_g1~~TRINITY_DN21440_c0_g1_i1.p2  ORF type:complete len:127 (-),score=16.24 TRINITY_DN21440_c0_g1_i1:321-701(-)
MALHRRGQKLLLLCHCGVTNLEKPCHALLIQQYLVASESNEDVNTLWSSERTCANCSRDWLQRGALDANTLEFYCVVCWRDFADRVSVLEEKYPLPDAPLLQPMDDEPSVKSAALEAKGTLEEPTS